MYGMVCRARARGKPAKTDAGGSETGIRPAMSDALRGLLDGVRARLPFRPRRTAAGAQAADPDDMQGAYATARLDRPATRRAA